MYIYVDRLYVIYGDILFQLFRWSARLESDLSRAKGGRVNDVYGWLSKRREVGGDQR